MAEAENPVLDFGFKPKAKSRGDVLVALWRQARVNAENGPACPCHGIYSGRIDPDTLETNLLAPLRTRYREAGQTDLRDVIERRLRKSPFAGLRQPFEGWLTGLADVKISDSDRKLLYDDIETALQYHAEAQPVFVCS